MSAHFMKYLMIIYFALSIPIEIFGQANQPVREGVVSYKTSQNIYVRFQSTDGMTTGDTLFKSENEGFDPVLVLRHVSSTSVVGVPIDQEAVEVGDILKFKPKFQVADGGQAQELVEPIVSDEPQSSKLAAEAVSGDLRTQLPNIKGRIGIASYINYANDETDGRQHMRYSLSLDAQRMGGSRFSADSYIIFRHQVNEWEKVRANLASALKVYNLALTYETDNLLEISLGRKLNRHMANVGPIDGLQIQRTTVNMTIGLIGGTRPDYFDYSLNLDLLQFGGYVNHSLQTARGQLESTFAVIEQTYRSKTDRRYMYFQHSNSILQNLHFFGSLEVDLYQKQDDVVTHNFSPTSLYLSLRYRPNRKISFTTSFDARRNVIYYESFKSFIDQLIEEETRQGFRFRFHYRPFKFVVIGASAGYRTQRDNPNESKNLYTYITYTSIPYINASATVSSTLVRSSFLKGNIYRVGMQKNLFDDHLQTEVSYRFLDYTYGNPGVNLDQQMLGIRLGSSVSRKLSLSVNYEVTFQKTNTLTRIYANVIQRI